jgi:hypothetical protein
MRFSAVEEHKPPVVEIVRPEVFVATWEDRPRAEVAIGLRHVAFEDIRTARAQAGEKASQAHPKATPGDALRFPLWLEAFNDELMLWIVARAMCDANDVRKVWEPFASAPEDMAKEYMTPGGVRFLYDRWDRMRTATDPVARELEDEEIETLPAKLARLGELTRASRLRVRRFLAFAVDEIDALPAKE